MPEAPSTPILGKVDPEEALRSLKSADLGENSAASAPKSKYATEEYAFTVENTDGMNVARKGEFKSRILTIEERMNVSLLQAKLARGIPWEALDPEGQWLLGVIAHLTVSLFEKPAWFKPAEMKDIVLLGKVYAEVSAHEAFFRGPAAAQGAGA